MERTCEPECVSVKRLSLDSFKFRTDDPLGLVVVEIPKTVKPGRGAPTGSMSPAHKERSASQHGESRNSEKNS